MEVTLLLVLAENLLRSVVEVCHGERVEVAVIVTAVGRDVGAAGQLHLKVKVLKFTLHSIDTVTVKVLKNNCTAQLHVALQSQNSLKRNGRCCSTSPCGFSGWDTSFQLFSTGTSLPPLCRTWKRE